MKFHLLQESTVPHIAYLNLQAQTCAGSLLDKVGGAAVANPWRPEPAGAGSLALSAILVDAALAVSAHSQRCAPEVAWPLV